MSVQLVVDLETTGLYPSQDRDPGDRSGQGSDGEVADTFLYVCRSADED